MFNFLIISILFTIADLSCHGSKISDETYRINRQSDSGSTNNELCSVPKIEHGEFDFPIKKAQYTPGEPPPNFPVIAYCTNEKYVLNTTYAVVYCVNGIFEKDLPKCVLACPTINSNSVDVQCQLNGVERDCSREVPEGTIATVKCKPHYVELNPGPSTVKCLHGSWNAPPKKCIPDCGKPVTNGETLTINGRKVKRGQFPWHVAIYQQNSKKVLNYICGGSIISNRLVLSGAQCFTATENGKLHPISEFSVAAGKYFSNWDAPEDVNFVQKRKISKIEIQKDFLGYKSRFVGDIAVVVVEEPFVLTDYIKPICMDWNSDYVNQQLKGGAIGQVAGYGALKPDKPMASPFLKQLTFPFVELNQCLKTVPEEFKEFVTSDKYCAGYTNGTSLCLGDGGGGMVFPHEQNGKKIYYIQGIVSNIPLKPISNTALKNLTCDNYQLSIYTKVNSYISFIRNVRSLNEIY